MPQELSSHSGQPSVPIHMLGVEVTRHKDGESAAQASGQVLQPSLEQISLGDDWSLMPRGGRVGKAKSASLPKPTPTEITEAPKKAPETNTTLKARNKKPAPKLLESPKEFPTKKASTKHCLTTPIPPKHLVSPPTANPSPLERISDLLDTLPMDACVELSRRLVTAVPFLPPGPARSRAVLIIVILFVAEYGSTA
jgi:hypothetical protein